MKSRFRLWSCLAVLALGVGCSLCRNPYDYCGAVVGPSGQPTLGFNERAGSAFTGPGGPQTAAVPTLAKPEAGEPTPAAPLSERPDGDDSRSAQSSPDSDTPAAEIATRPRGR